MPHKLMVVEPLRLEWVEYSEPELGPEQVRIQSEFSASKHGTEMSVYKGYGNARGVWDGEAQIFRPGNTASPYPTSVGNMVVGSIVEAGAEVHSLSVGDRVFTHGGFSETHVRSAEACERLPEGMPWQSAACLDPAYFALGAIRDGNVRVGDTVAVFGLGAIALMVVQLARRAGADRVIAVDPLENRRRVAEALGADLTLDATACDAGAEIKSATGIGVDVAIEFSGAWQALQAATRGCAFGGTVVCGAYPAPHGAGLDLGAEAHLNRPNLVFSRACSDPSREHPRWDMKRIERTCLKMFAAGDLSGAEIVSPVVPFEDLLDEYPKIADDPGSNIKLGAKH